MKHIFLLLLILVSEKAFTQEQSLQWYKGNTHTHSLWSDGKDFPEVIIDWYKSRGYSFLVLSEHNILALGEKWVNLSNDPFRKERVSNYLEKYKGNNNIPYRTDSAGLISIKLRTHAEYQKLFEEENKFLIMPGEEMTDLYGFIKLSNYTGGKRIHSTAVNIQEIVKPAGGNSVAEVISNNINQVSEQSQRTGEPMLTIVNHPNYMSSIRVEDLIQVKGLRFFEIYNGNPSVNNYGTSIYGDSTLIGTEEIWDRLLIHNIEHGRELVYGIASDDAHNFLEYEIGKPNPGRGWVMVHAAELTPSALIDAMERGQFYSTTGVEIEELSFKNHILNVAVKPQRGVEYTIQFWGAAKSKGSKEKAGVLLKEVKGISASSYKLRRRDLYVRAKIISSKLKENPYAEGDLESAWIQPVRR
jgi:hypothetical protein